MDEKNYRRPCRRSQKYTKSFALYVGGDEVYEKYKADALEAELKPAKSEVPSSRRCSNNTIHDPAHNPQSPRQKHRPFLLSWAMAGDRYDVHLMFTLGIDNLMTAGLFDDDRTRPALIAALEQPFAGMTRVD